MVSSSLPRLWLLVPLTAMAAGCASEGPFPSLAPRPTERLSMDEPTRVPPTAAPDPALGARIEELVHAARQGQARFEEALPAATSQAREAGAAGSESWVAAQQALSRLEAARALTVAALGDLDRLAIERTGRPTDTAQYSALLAAVETAGSLAESQQNRIDGLRASLSPA